MHHEELQTGGDHGASRSNVYMFGDSCTFSSRRAAQSSLECLQKEQALLSSMNGVEQTMCHVQHAPPVSVG
jgi:hypothetical protein